MRMTEQERKAELECGSIKLSVRLDPDGRVWRYCDCCFGSYDELGFSRNVEVWPAEAIARARAELDALERELEDEQ